MKPLVIGNSLEVNPPLVLAPLAGHTDRAFRGLVRRLGGCGLVVTEMVSSEGLTRGSQASREIAAVTHEERPVGVQVFGTDPDRLAAAANMVDEFGADLVDVNMGCPVPKVTRLGAGAALMRDVKRASELISQMVKSASIPVTAKIRSGWDYDSINAREVARALEDAGAAAITVHPRCRSERHRGKAAWQVIRDVKEAVKIPVIGNGDVRSAEDARAMIAETGVDAIMIGRGALENPWVFRQVSDELSGRESSHPTMNDYRQAITFFTQSLKEYLPDKLVVNRVKALIGWISKGLPGGAALRRNIYASKTLPEVTQVFEVYFTDSNCQLPEEKAHLAPYPV
jgi:nifR3 family TIM-barrel protein